MCGLKPCGWVAVLPRSVNFIFSKFCALELFRHRTLYGPDSKFCYLSLLPHPWPPGLVDAVWPPLPRLNSLAALFSTKFSTSLS
jgi:hypothetical protein